MTEKNLRILVVEDSDFQRKIILRDLAAKGFYAEAVARGREALQVIYTEPVDVVIADYEMPEISGIELYRLVHDKMGKRMPDFILCTASQKADVHQRALEVGFRVVVVKEPGFEDLFAALDLMQRVYAALPEAHGSGHDSHALG